MSDGQYFQYTNASLSHSAPALSMDCETQQHTTLHQNGIGKMSSVCAPIVRVVKRRNTANKKERRRTQSINTAFADLRDCIPNVPCDTKLSKVSAGKRDTRRTDTINCAFSLLRNRIPNVPTDTKLSKVLGIVFLGMDFFQFSSYGVYILLDVAEIWCYRYQISIIFPSLESIPLV